ncbi:calpain-A-like [Colletes latitarsis]|uniref:calpain-A-like n=1 Tax=Colletes latitarsis TaxID=2605962 RepID=UPI0040375492
MNNFSCEREQEVVVPKIVRLEAHKPKLGEKGSGFLPRAGVQDFGTLRRICCLTRTLFEDPEFPATDSSLYYSKSPDKSIVWKRPKDIVPNPQLFVKSFSRFDINQGELGDCWLLAAIANLAMDSNLFFQVVPQDQSFEKCYFGIFHFRFWQYGRWVDVVIDDRLPTRDGQLVYLHSTEKNEFWCALLEKAYAKLHGSYEALIGGICCEAMEDFTGGVLEIYEMKKIPPDLFIILLKAFERKSLMGCSTPSDPRIFEAKKPQGLVGSHAYSITHVKYVDIQMPSSCEMIPLLRLRNPWGNKVEWEGPWSDKSPKWKSVSENLKKKLGLTFNEDGEFWMSFQDFTHYFSQLDICNLSPDSLTEDDLNAGKKKWKMSTLNGQWVRGVTAGGCKNHLETFWHNPQYRITLEYPDEDDGKCTVVVALMQKNRRAQRRMGAENVAIGFEIYHLKDPARLPKPLDFNFFKDNGRIVSTEGVYYTREVTRRFKFPPGVYCIVPCTFKPNEEAEFLLRIFSENQNNMEENDEEVCIGEVDDRVIYPKDDNKQGNGDAIQGEPESGQNEDNIREFFKKLAGEDMEVDWMELKEILDFAMRKETHDLGFSKDVCRSMVAMLDVDHSGKLGFEEFRTLWNDIRKWRAVFKLYDKDESGSLRAFELRQALNSAGYRLNNHILNIFGHRYGTKEGMITFDDFIMCAVRLKTLIDIFRERDPELTNTASFTMEEWIEKTLYS